MIERLENNEQILLLYLAGELPDGDRENVEQMLAADASLQRSLDELGACQSATWDGLGRLDELSPLFPTAEVAARRVGRAMRQHLAQPKIVASASGAQPSRRSWWWLYPTAAAACVALFAILWISKQPPVTSMPGVVPHIEPDPIAVAPVTPVNPTPPGSAVATVRNNSTDSDTALLLDSLNSPMPADDSASAHGSADDDSKRVAVNDSMPQDEISQYLLGAAATNQ